MPGGCKVYKSRFPDLCQDEKARIEKAGGRVVFDGHLGPTADFCKNQQFLLSARLVAVLDLFRRKQLRPSGTRTTVSTPKMRAIQVSRMRGAPAGFQRFVAFSVVWFWGIRLQF